MKKTFRQCAIDYIQNRHLCKGYVDYIVSQLDKLDKIEQIVNKSYTEDEFYYVVRDIKEVLEQDN